jgi:hypothetical protein
VQVDLKNISKSIPLPNKITNRLIKQAGEMQSRGGIDAKVSGF